MRFTNLAPCPSCGQPVLSLIRRHRDFVLEEKPGPWKVRTDGVPYQVRRGDYRIHRCPRSEARGRFAGGFRLDG